MRGSDVSKETDAKTAAEENTANLLPFIPTYPTPSTHAVVSSPIVLQVKDDVPLASISVDDLPSFDLTVITDLEAPDSLNRMLSQLESREEQLLRYSLRYYVSKLDSIYAVLENASTKTKEEVDTAIGCLQSWLAYPELVTALLEKDASQEKDASRDPKQPGFVERLTQVVEFLLERAETTIREEMELAAEDRVIAQGIFHAVLDNPSLYQALPDQMQRQLLMWDWPQTDRDTFDLDALNDIQTQWMRPLLDYADHEAARYRNDLFGGNAAAKRIMAARNRLATLPALAIYRWSAALMQLSLQFADGSDFQTGYQALLCDWLADGSSASLGEAMRSTPWFWLFTRRPSNDALSTRILAVSKKQRTYPAASLKIAHQFARVRPTLSIVAELLKPLAEIKRQLLHNDPWEWRLPEAIDQLINDIRLAGQQRSIIDFVTQALPRISNFNQRWLPILLLSDVTKAHVKTLMKLRAQLIDLPRQLNRAARLLYNKLDTLVVGSKAVQSAARRKQSLEERLVERFSKVLGLVGGVHYVLSGLHYGTEALLAALEVIKGVGELGENALGLFEGSSIAEQLRHLAYSKLGVSTPEAELHHIVQAFQSADQKYRLSQVAHRVVDVYQDSLLQLTEAGQAQWCDFVLGIMLAYVRYGCLDKLHALSDEALAQHLVGWLVFADPALSQKRFMKVTRNISLPLQRGGDVAASLILSQSGVIAQDKKGRWFRFWYGKQNPVRYGYRLALPYEADVLNEFIHSGQRSGNVHTFGSGKTTLRLRLYYGDDLREYEGEFRAIITPYVSNDERLERIEEKQVVFRDTVTIHHDWLAKAEAVIKKQADEIQVLKNRDELRMAEIEKQEGVIKLMLKEMEVAQEQCRPINFRAIRQEMKSSKAELTATLDAEKDTVAESWSKISVRPGLSIYPSEVSPSRSSRRPTVRGSDSRRRSPGAGFFDLPVSSSTFKVSTDLEGTHLTVEQETGTIRFNQKGKG